MATEPHAAAPPISWRVIPDPPDPGWVNLGNGLLTQAHEHGAPVPAGSEAYIPRRTDR